MLRKLLKYDFKAVLKYWWIAAVTSVGLSFVGGLCLRVMTTSAVEVPAIVAFAMVIVFIFALLSLLVFSVLSMILIFIRFYKNFFTDEGYLTFTLPVKRSELLNSKVIMSTAMTLLTGMICIINMLFMIEVGEESAFFAGLFESIVELFSEAMKEAPIYFILLLLEFLVLTVLITAFSNMFMFCCITFASIITKKAKVITAIGIYYAANGIFSFVVQIFFIFGLSSISEWLADLPIGAQPPMTILFIFVIILFVALVSALLYTLEYYMLDRKLNLS